MACFIDNKELTDEYKILLLKYAPKIKKMDFCYECILKEKEVLPASCQYMEKVDDDYFEFLQQKQSIVFLERKGKTIKRVYPVN